MKVKIGYEELWRVVIDGDHCGGVVVNLPVSVAKKCIAAHKCWLDTLDILEDAYLAHVAKHGEPRRN